MAEVFPACRVPPHSSEISQNAIPFLEPATQRVATQPLRVEREKPLEAVSDMLLSKKAYIDDVTHALDFILQTGGYHARSNCMDFCLGKGRSGAGL